MPDVQFVKKTHPFKGNTTNLFSHLKHDHRAVYLEVLPKIRPVPAKTNRGTTNGPLGFLENQNTTQDEGESSLDESRTGEKMLATHVTIQFGYIY